LCRIKKTDFEKDRAQNSTAHHSAYFGKRALEAARGADFAEICSLPASAPIMQLV